MYITDEKRTNSVGKTRQENNKKYNLCWIYMYYMWGFDSIWKAPAHGEGHSEPGTVRRWDKTQCGTRSNLLLFDISLSDKVDYFLAAVDDHYPQTLW